jgi:Na+-translocating ferredoxin:NAD+ oxidoreductase RnfC subunit
MEKLPIKSRAELADRLRSLGVVGAGGAGFPTHVKIQADCATLIVNGAECEPLLESDKHILFTEAEKIFIAMDMVVKMNGADRGVLAVKGKYTKVVKRLKEAVRAFDTLEVLELANYYPAGDEHSLVREVTGVSVPPAAIPIAVGCIVQNVETMRNIYEAAFNNAPVTARFLTCGGAVARPSIVQARLGVSFHEVIAACGGTTLDEYVVLVGGPMMGRIERGADLPVTKLTSGIIVLPPDHPLTRTSAQSRAWVIARSKTACCQCSYCTEMCPRHLLGHKLEPHKIMRQINLGLDIPHDVIKGALLCSECGMCEVVSCTMDLSPRLMNRYIKQALREAGYKADFSGEKAVASEMWAYRKIPTERVINRLGLSRYDVHPTRLVEDLASKRVEILVRQHIGAPAAALVRTGDKVKRGDAVGDIPAGAMGARVHASIDGEVVLADKERVIIQAQ